MMTPQEGGIEAGAIPMPGNLHRRIIGTGMMMTSAPLLIELSIPARCHPILSARGQEKRWRDHEAARE